MHSPGHRKTLTVAKRGINRETTLFNIRQQMGEVTMDSDEPLMLAKRILQYGIGMIERA